MDRYTTLHDINNQFSLSVPVLSVINGQHTFHSDPIQPCESETWRTDHGLQEYQSEKRKLLISDVSPSPLAHAIQERLENLHDRNDGNHAQLQNLLHGGLAWGGSLISGCPQFIMVAPRFQLPAIRSKISLSGHLVNWTPQPTQMVPKLQCSVV